MYTDGSKTETKIDSGIYRDKLRVDPSLGLEKFPILDETV